jgi:hypothetical protein
MISALPDYQNFTNGNDKTMLSSISTDEPTMRLLRCFCQKQKSCVIIVDVIPCTFLNNSFSGVVEDINTF